MRRHRLAGLLSTVLVLTASAAALPGAHAASAPPAAVAAHPRLLFSAQDVPGLRARVAAGGAAWLRLKDRADEHLVRVQPDIVRADIGVPANLQGLEKPYTLQNEMPTYLIDLGMAYQVSGDERYGRRVIDLLLALGDAHWPYWAPQDLGVGDLLEGVGLGFDWTYELMTPAERQKIVGDITRDDKLLLDRLLVNPTHPASRYPRSNWMGVTAGGAGLTALAVRGEPGAPKQVEDYIARAMSLVRTFFLAAVDRNGAYNEGHTYAYYGMKNSVPFAVAVKHAGRGDLFAGTGLRAMARWQALEQLPGEGQNFVPLNDSGRPQFGAGLPSLHFAIDPDNPVAQWLWQRTVGPLGEDLYGDVHPPSYVIPSECSQPRYNPEPVALAACPIANLHDNVWAILFYRSPKQTPERSPASQGLSAWHVSRGLVDARTGFDKGTDEAVSTFEAHRDGTAHFQYDVGSFTLYGKGGRFAVDPGTSCVACGNNDDMGYAVGHNVILVDGKKDTQYRFLRYYFGPTINSYFDAPTFTLTRADTRYAYGFEPPYAERDHLFGRTPGRPILVAVGDSLQRDKIPFERANPNDHTYTWQMLTQFDNSVATSGSAFTVTAPNGATVVGRSAVDGAATSDPSFTTREFLYQQLAYDLPGAHVLTTTTKPSQRFDQLTVLALTGAGEPAGATTILRVKGGNAVAVDWKGGRDVVVRRLKLSAGVTGVVAMDGTIAKYTKDSGDSVLREGTRLVGEGREYVHVTGARSTVTVSGATAAATGGGTQFRVFAPKPLTVATVNGRAVRSCRTGSYVTFPCWTASGAATPVDLAPASDQLPRTGVARTGPPPSSVEVTRIARHAPLGAGVLVLLLILTTMAVRTARSSAPLGAHG